MKQRFIGGRRRFATLIRWCRIGGEWMGQLGWDASSRSVALSGVHRKLSGKLTGFGQ
jgi:hypothetical protein